MFLVSSASTNFAPSTTSFSFWQTFSPTASLSFLEPISYDSNAGYVSGTSFYAYSNQNYFNDVYLLEVGHYYIITLGKTIANRFRAVTLAIDPTLPSVSGQQVRGDLSRADSSSPTRVTVNKFQCGSDYIYLAITKSTTGVSGIKTYVIDCTDWS